MGDEKEVHPSRRKPTLPRVNDPIGDRSPTNDDITPLGAGGRVNWIKAAKVAAIAIPLVIGAIVSAVEVAYQRLKPLIEDYRQAGQKRTDKGYETVAPRVNILEQRMHDVEVRLEAASKPAAIQPPRHPGTRRRPAVLAVIPPAQHPPIVLRPLPKDLDKAQVQVIAPQPRSAVDGGP